jgi:hypothetical protein
MTTGRTYNPNRTNDPAWLGEYGQRPQLDPRCGVGDGSCGHRSITDCHNSRVRATGGDRAARGDFRV